MVYGTLNGRSHLVWLPGSNRSLSTVFSIPMNSGGRDGPALWLNKRKHICYCLEKLGEHDEEGGSSSNSLNMHCPYKKL